MMNNTNFNHFYNGIVSEIYKKFQEEKEKDALTKPFLSYSEKLYDELTTRGSLLSKQGLSSICNLIEGRILDTYNSYFNDSNDEDISVNLVMLNTYLLKIIHSSSSNLGDKFGSILEDMTLDIINGLGYDPNDPVETYEAKHDYLTEDYDD